MNRGVFGGDAIKLNHRELVINRVIPECSEWYSFLIIKEVRFPFRNGLITLGNISVPDNKTTKPQTTIMASSDFNTQVLDDQPSKMIQECDKVFRSIVEFPGKIPYHLTEIIVDQLWAHFRTWLNRHLKEKCDRPKPLSGLRAIDKRISMGGEREKAIFVQTWKFFTTISRKVHHTNLNIHSLEY